jgi:hypothetical protein
MRIDPMTEAIRMALNESQKELRDNLTNREYWEKRWVEDPDSVCSDLMALYTVTGEGTREMITSLINEKFESAEAVAKKDMEELKSLVQDAIKSIKEVEFKRKSDREVTDRNTAEINLLKHSNANMALKVDHINTITTSMPDSINNLHKSVNALHDSVNAIAVHRSEPAAKQTSAGIPIGRLAWFGALSAGVALFLLIALVTGLGSEAMEMLGKLPFLGG